MMSLQNFASFWAIQATVRQLINILYTQHKGIILKKYLGKSTLCNRLTGDESEYGDKGPFIVSDDGESETTKVQIMLLWTLRALMIQRIRMMITSMISFIICMAVVVSMHCFVFLHSCFNG